MKTKSHIYKLINLAYRNHLRNNQEEELDRWLAESDENVSEYHAVMKALTFSDWLVSMKKIDTAGDLLQVKKQFGKKGLIRNIFYNYQKIAAVLLIPFFVLSLWLLSRNNGQSPMVTKTAETAFGVRSRVELADGTAVWLNSGSKLTYPETFRGKIREVKLRGEAYFHVKSDVNHPFYVDLDGYKVKATGTSFNITSYQEENVYIYLEHGKVQLVEMQKKAEVKSLNMNEGETVILDREKKEYRVSREDGSKYLGWTQGKLIFRNDKIKDVARRLGNWYNADIIVKDESINDYIFTATFRNETLEEALKLLSYSSPITYQIISERSPDDSGMNKKRIIIEKRKTMD